MKQWVLLLTIIVAVALIPLAIWTHDILAISLAGLIPFYVDWKNGDLP